MIKSVIMTNYNYQKHELLYIFDTNGNFKKVN